MMCKKMSRKKFLTWLQEFFFEKCEFVKKDNG